MYKLIDRPIGDGQQINFYYSNNKKKRKKTKKPQNKTKKKYKIINFVVLWLSHRLSVVGESEHYFFFILFFLLWTQASRHPFQSGQNKKNE